MCQQEEETLKKREVVGGKLLQEMQRELPRSQSSFQASTRARAGLQLSRCCRRLQQTALPIIPEGEGGKAVLITAEQTAREMLKQLLDSKQAKGESLHHHEIEMHAQSYYIVFHF